MNTIFGPEMLQNPYPIYHRLRSEDPVHWDEGQRVWILTRYDDVETAFAHPLLSSAVTGNFNAEDIQKMGFHGEEARTLLAGHHMMVFSDDPAHRRLRGLVNLAFTPKAIEARRPNIQKIVDQLLDPLQRKGRMDLIEDFAYRVPMLVVAEMLGLPVEDPAILRQWSEDLTSFISTPKKTQEQSERTFRGCRELSNYLRPVLEELRKRPKNDILSALLAAEEKGDRLTLDELISNVIFIFSAGHMTTTHLIGNAILALLLHPPQLQLLLKNPGLIESTIEETLRYDPPLQFSLRVAKENFEFRGKKILKGESVISSLGGANRDPEVFPDPDRFDMARKSQRHFAFGYGPHFCIGAPLARLESQIAVNAILSRWPDLRLSGGPLKYAEQYNIRGLERLPVLF